jgi:hypothetical protein
LTQNFKEDEPDLKVKYQFKGIEIKNLWKYIIKFQNKSRKTIIASGNKKNILTDNIILNLKKEYIVLDYVSSSDNCIFGINLIFKKNSAIQTLLLITNNT